MTVSITIDGQPIQASDGQTILQAAREHGLRIPTLCYHKDLSPTGNCRICVVEVAKQRFLQAACVTQVWEGMKIQINSEKAVKSRKLSLELMLANHPQDCITCDVSGECELQRTSLGQQGRALPCRQ
jgi:NADH dehydrogenase/NADH:ubiquinone oxidoreductase subunit G